MKKTIIITAIIAILLAMPSFAALYDDLIVNITFFEEVGGVIEDTKNSFNVTTAGGALSEGILNESCIVGSCLWVAPTSSVETIDLGADWDIVPTEQNKTICMWIKSNESSPALANPYFFSGMRAATTSAFRISDISSTNTLRIEFIGIDGGGAPGLYQIVSVDSTGTNVTDSEWHYICSSLSFNTTVVGEYMTVELRMYINGILANNSFGEDILSDGTTVYAVNDLSGFIRDTAASQHHFYIDEFMIWNRTLSSNEIAQSYLTYTSNSTLLFNEPIYEGTEEIYHLNTTILTITDAIFNVTVQFFFNDTEQTLTDHYNVSDVWVFETSATVPFFSEYEQPFNISSFWNYTIQYESQNVTTQVDISQVVDFVANVSDCNSGTEPSDIIYYFELKDEQDVENETGMMDLDITLTYANKTQLSYGLNFSGYDNYTICIFPSYKNLTADVDIQSWNDEPSIKKTYYIVNDTITNTTTTHTLYLLPTTNSSNIYFHVSDQNFYAIANAYVYVNRQYIGEGVSRTVEISRSDYDGEALLHLEPYDVFYQFVIIKDGQIIYTTQPDIITRTDYYFSPIIGATFYSEYLEVQGFLYDMTFNNVTETCTLTYTDTQSAADEVCLKIRYNRGGNSEVVCDTCQVSSPAGSITCNTNMSKQGTYVCSAYIKGHDSYIGSESVYVDSNQMPFGNTGLIGAWFMTGTIGLLGIAHPIVLVAFTLLGLGTAVSLKMIALGAVSIVALLIVGFIIIMRARA